MLTGHDIGGLLVEAVDERVAVGLAEHRGGQREEQLGACLELALQLGSDLRQLALVLRGAARAPGDGRVGPVARAVMQPLPRSEGCRIRKSDGRAGLAAGCRCSIRRE